MPPQDIFNDPAVPLQRMIQTRSAARLGNNIQSPHTVARLAAIQSLPSVLSFLDIPETKAVDVIAMIGSKRPQAALSRPDPGRHTFETGEE